MRTTKTTRVPKPESTVFIERAIFPLFELVMCAEQARALKLFQHTSQLFHLGAEN